MKRLQQQSLLLWLTTVVAMSLQRINASEDVRLKSSTSQPLQFIPHSGNNSNITKLECDGGNITLNEADRQALASYPRLVQLQLDGNKVTRIPARYFSVVPQLRGLSLSGNDISSLEVESFSGLEFLTELDLSHNQLTSLQRQLFIRLKKLQVLKLQGNPWNCTCPLLSSTEEVNATGVTAGGPNITCASLESDPGRDFLQTVSMCRPPITPFITNQQKTTPQVEPQQATGLTTTLTSQNHLSKDQTPVQGNTWKFTAYVALLALCTSMLIVCGIKGPSWYKLFHDYRHRRLHQEDDEDAVSTVFTETGGFMNQQTFIFEEENGQIVEEEDEDGYFEDPYINNNNNNTFRRED